MSKIKLYFLTGFLGAGKTTIFEKSAGKHGRNKGWGNTE